MLSKLTDKQSQLIIFILQACLSGLLLIAFLQDYTNFAPQVMGYKLHPFYHGVFLRLLPLLILSIYTFPLLRSAFKFDKKQYIPNQIIFILLLLVDAFTHITNIYAVNYNGLLGWDKVMHFNLGLFASLVFMPICIDYFKTLSQKYYISLGSWFYFGILSVFTCIWEIIEVALYLFAETGFLIPDKLDASLDIAANYLGALLSGLFVWTYYKLSQIKS